MAALLLADGNHINMLGGVRVLLEKPVQRNRGWSPTRLRCSRLSCRWNPTLVIVNLSLPVTCNINIMSQLNSRYPSLKIIVLSVHDPAAAVQAVFFACRD